MILFSGSILFDKQIVFPLKSEIFRSPYDHSQHITPNSCLYDTDVDHSTFS